MTVVRIVTCTARGLPAGESHHLAYPETQVRLAKTLYTAGWSITKIAAQLNGPHRSTVSRWLSGARRNKAVRVIARRVTPAITERLVASLLSEMQDELKAETSSACDGALVDDFSDLV
jgi:hypothetical protein